MKKLFTAIAFLFVFNVGYAQELTGVWSSSDSTRSYEITQTGNNEYTAVIRSSTREKDSVGFVVLKDLAYNERKKRFEGLIFAVSDGQANYVKIKFDPSDPDKLNLTLSRMFLFPVSIAWVRSN